MTDYRSKRPGSYWSGNTQVLLAAARVLSDRGVTDFIEAIFPAGQLSEVGEGVETTTIDGKFISSPGYPTLRLGVSIDREIEEYSSIGLGTTSGFKLGMLEIKHSSVRGLTSRYF